MKSTLACRMREEAGHVTYALNQFIKLLTLIVEHHIMKWSWAVHHTYNL
jgi:hypothetical protein